MNFDELKSRLLREAHEAGICDEGYETLRECEDIDTLLDFYTENPDWLEKARRFDPLGHAGFDPVGKINLTL